MYGKVGRQVLASGGVGPIRMDKDGNIMAAVVGPEYADLVEAGRVFSAANQAAVSTTAALATTWTGLGIGNPAASGKNYVMLEFGAGQAAAAVAGVLGLMVADLTGLAQAITPVSQDLGTGLTSDALVDDGATIGTPVLYRACGSIGSDATTDYPLTPGVVYPLNGSIIIPPGASLLTYTTGACTSAFIFSFLWAEVDV